ncbi:MAG TPA: 4Fe-4S dicluster domain-containing protein [Spirochaetota bacterium]|nr:4Fe-4S dicluster domain-containing protein [Spirochaetota bacterium]
MNKSKSAYENLAERINRFPQGAPPTALLFDILKVLFTEKEASLVARLPLKPFTVERAASIWKTDPATARKNLDGLAAKALIVDLEIDGKKEYALPPPMAGFFEFSMMRTRNDIDQKTLGELFYQYINVEEDFIRDLFVDGETKMVKVFVNESVLPEDRGVEILDYERASETIKTASHRGIGLCYCRHKMQHNGRACRAPLDICMTFGRTAASLIRNGFAREVDVSEGLDQLARAHDLNLVQCAENVRNDAAFICNCCGCCCEALIAARKFSFLRPVSTTNFLPGIDRSGCSGCGKCVDVCPVEAMALVSANDPAKPKARTALLNEDICLGCGVCARACPSRSISMLRRKQRVITPASTAHRTVLMAIERGKLQDLIFDNRALFSHRALAAVLGVILRLPPVKQAMASRQMKSVYLDRLLERYNGSNR